MHIHAYHCIFFHLKPIGIHLHTSTQSFQWCYYTAGCIQRYLQHTHLYLHFHELMMKINFNITMEFELRHCTYQCTMFVCHPSGIPLDIHTGRNQPHSHTELNRNSCVYLLHTHQYLYQSIVYQCFNPVALLLILVTLIPPHC